MANSKKLNNGLTAKQDEWTKHFTNADPDARTFMNATASAEASGYGGKKRSYQTCANAGLINIRNPKVMAVVDEILAKVYDPTRITIDKVLIDLEVCRLLAIRSGQLSVARQCSRDMGQYLKMFVERIEQVQTVEDSSTEELASLLGDVLKKINDPDILKVLRGPSGTVTREGGIVPVERDKAAN